MSGSNRKGFRKERQEQFFSPTPGSYSSLSGALAACAWSELKNALKDRYSDRVVVCDGNHYSHHALGSIVLVVCAAEAWLVELIAVLGRADPRIRLLADLSSSLKMYTKLHEWATGEGSKPPASLKEDFESVVNIRDELVHPKPRVVPGGVPSRLSRLATIGLFIKTPDDAPGDYDWQAKLCSYKLAYWVWESLDSALSELYDTVSALPAKRGGAMLSPASLMLWNLRLYKNLDSPDSLATDGCCSG